VDRRPIRMRREFQPSPFISLIHASSSYWPCYVFRSQAVRPTNGTYMTVRHRSGWQERREREREIGGHGAAVEGGAASAPHPLPPPILASRLRSRFVFLCPFISLLLHHTSFKENELLHSCARCSPPPPHWS
jgi:hypothetical protein